MYFRNWEFYICFLESPLSKVILLKIMFILFFVVFIDSATDSEADRVVQEESAVESVDPPSEEVTDVSNSGVRATDVDSTLKLASPQASSSSSQQGLLFISLTHLLLCLVIFFNFLFGVCLRFIDRSSSSREH